MLLQAAINKAVQSSLTSQKRSSCQGMGGQTRMGVYQAQ